MDEGFDEGALKKNVSKEFVANASKFKTQPNKIKNKIVILNKEEEEEFHKSFHTSINNHMS